MWLRELGYSRAEIAAALNLTDRSIRGIFQKGNLEGNAMVSITQSAVPRERLAPEFRAMLEDTVEAFEAFYNYFSEYPLPDHCREWVQDYLDNPRLLLNVPPGHNKSTIFCQWIPVWELVKNRNAQILLVSLSSQLATMWTSYISVLLTYTEIPQIFGRFAPDKNSGDEPWRPSKGELMVVGRTSTHKNPGAQFSVLSRGSGGAVLGFRATHIIVDDVTDADTAISDAKREREDRWFFGAVASRLQPKGRFVVIGQRVDIRDIYGKIADMKYLKGPKTGTSMWHHIQYPAVLRWPEDEDETGDAKVLWPEQWPYEELMDKYGTLGEKLFSCMFQQEPMPDGAGLVRAEWLERCRDPRRKGGQGYRAEGTDGEFFPVVRVASLDPSPTEYNGAIIADVLYDRGQFWCFILTVETFKGGMQAQKRWMRKVLSEYHPDYMIVERNIAQHLFQGDPDFEDVKQRTTVMEHRTSATNKNDIELGMESLAADFEQARISLPYGDSYGIKSSAILEHEAMIWAPQTRITADALHALWFIKWNHRRLVPRRNLQDHFDGTEGREHWYLKEHRPEVDKARAWREHQAQARHKRRQRELANAEA
jgi:hypothetical protein